MDEYERTALRLVLSVAATVLAALVYVGFRWGEVGVLLTLLGVFALVGVAAAAAALYVIALILAEAIGDYLRSRD